MIAVLTTLSKLFGKNPTNFPSEIEKKWWISFVSRQFLPPFCSDCELKCRVDCQDIKFLGQDEFNQTHTFGRMIAVLTTLPKILGKVPNIILSKSERIDEVVFLHDSSVLQIVPPVIWNMFLTTETKKFRQKRKFSWVNLWYVFEIGEWYAES